MLAKAIVEHNDDVIQKAERTRGGPIDGAAATAEIGAAIPLAGILVGNGAIATGDWYEGWLTGLRTANAFSKALYSPALREQLGC